MDTWITFWKWLCVVSVIVYFLMGLVLVPLAVRDLFILVKKLNINNGSPPSQSMPGKEEQ